MKDKELECIEKNMLSSLDNEVKLENDINAKSVQASHDLARNNKAELELANAICYLDTSEGKEKIRKDVVYDIRSQVKGKKLILVASDKDLMNLVHSHYVPHVIVFDLVDSVSMEENLRAAVNAFCRHKYELTNVEALDD